MLVQVPAANMDRSALRATNPLIQAGSLRPWTDSGTGPFDQALLHLRRPPLRNVPVHSEHGQVPAGHKKITGPATRGLFRPGAGSGTGPSAQALLHFPRNVLRAANTDSPRGSQVPLYRSSAAGVP